MSTFDDGLFDGGRKLPVMEEFYTLQGEGFNMGQAAYFIRIGGCDVGCSWCDTKQSWDASLFPPVAVDEVVERAAKTLGKTVVVTGGEPSRYPLDYLTQQLHKKGLKTMIETSGVQSLSGDWDWICLSPKKYIPPHTSIYLRANELKVIVQNPGDLQWAEKNAALVGKDCVLYLQPEWTKAAENMEMLTTYVMENPKWRMSLQAHKYMRIP
ncbi:MAG: 7-carboxy-7-deazaguanine synthase QueE [Bacteroidales bacterium]|nr:7-carboxy-7-deazaguanine synthase QueE [Bacteroidales bacterium]